MSGARRFEVIYSKDRSKKRKLFSDGKLTLVNQQLFLHDLDGEFVAKRRLNSKENKDIQEGDTLEMFQFEVQIERELVGEDSDSVREETAVTSEDCCLGERSVLDCFVGKGSGLLPITASSFQKSRQSSSHKALEIDHSLQRIMRAHQIEACEFLFKALDDDGEGGDSMDTAIRGAILADEMGLGKTLTSIAVVWAYIRRDRCKCIVVCPSGLVLTWKKVHQGYRDRNCIIDVLLGVQEVATCTASSRCGRGRKDSSREYSNIPSWPYLNDSCMIKSSSNYYDCETRCSLYLMKCIGNMRN